MKKADLLIHASIVERVRIRHQQTAEPNPVVLEVLNMLEQEYQNADQIVPTED